VSRIFISHSSVNNAEAIAVQAWLADNGWDDVFIDLDPERGFKPSDRWQEALKRAAERCEAVICLLSPAWRTSVWCVAEFLLAKHMNKRIVGVIIDPIPLRDLPAEMTTEWHLVDLTAGTRNVTITITLPSENSPVTVAFAQDGLARLKIGLWENGFDARYFEWPPSGSSRLI
jgi:TIR domain